MGTIFVATHPDSHVSITRITPKEVLNLADFDSAEDFNVAVILNDLKQDRRLPKTMFELSRLTDFDTHFDPLIHTLEAIAIGLPGHIPLACVEMDDAMLPANRTERDKWEIFDGGVRVKPA